MIKSPFLFGKGLLKKELSSYEQKQKEEAIKAIMAQVLYKLDYLGCLYGIVNNVEEQQKIKEFSYKLECVFSEWHINTNYKLLIKDVDYLISQANIVNFYGIIDWTKELLKKYFNDLKLLLKVDYSELI